MPRRPGEDRRRDGPQLAAAREAKQPIAAAPAARPSRIPGHKAWALIDAAVAGNDFGRRQVSEKHCNFLLNLGSATSADIEALGEEVRRRVLANSASPLNGKSSGSAGNEQGFARRVLMGGWSSEREVSLTSGAASPSAARARLVERHRARHGPQRRAAARPS
jgi:hypothetical protein